MRSSLSYNQMFRKSLLFPIWTFVSIPFQNQMTLFHIISIIFFTFSSSINTEDAMNKDDTSKMGHLFALKVPLALNVFILKHRIASELKTMKTYIEGTLKKITSDL